MLEGQMLWWVVFLAGLVFILALDLGVFHRSAHTVSFREAIGWSVVWVTLAMVFNAVVYHWYGQQAALEFFTGYLIEKSLAVDNIFVFVMVFAYFRVPSVYQHKVLFWGIIGALLLRAAFIFAGVELIERFHWTIYVFGLLLIATGVKMLIVKDKKIEPERNPVIRLFRRIVPVADDYGGDRFFIRRAGKWMATPLFVVLVFVELSDLIFAIDSIPAILAVTQDPFIVFTSNALAILGLRSMYFAVGGLMQMFHYLHYALSAILMFVGGKMLLVDTVKVPTSLSLGVIAAILVAAIAASWLWKPARHDEPAGDSLAKELVPTADRLDESLPVTSEVSSPV